MQNNMDSKSASLTRAAIQEEEHRFAERKIRKKKGEDKRNTPKP